MREPLVICSLHGMKRIMIDQLLYSILFFLDLHSPKTCMDTTNHRKLRGNPWEIPFSKPCLKDLQGRSFSDKSTYHPRHSRRLTGSHDFLGKCRFLPRGFFLFVVFLCRPAKNGKLILCSYIYIYRYIQCIYILYIFGDNGGS